jgi:hypothetical protein
MVVAEWLPCVLTTAHVQWPRCSRAVTVPMGHMAVSVPLFHFVNYFF